MFTITDQSRYNEQRDLILKADTAKPVFIGVSGRHNKVKKQHGCLDDQKEWEDKQCVLRPEVFLIKRPGEKVIDWNVELNVAFMDGAISSGREIILVTNFNYFNHFDDKGFAGNGVFYELLALHKNNYNFSKRDGKIIATKNQGDLTINKKLN